MMDPNISIAPPRGISVRAQVDHCSGTPHRKDLGLSSASLNGFQKTIYLRDPAADLFGFRSQERLAVCRIDILLAGDVRDPFELAEYSLEAGQN